MTTTTDDLTPAEMRIIRVNYGLDALKRSETLFEVFEQYDEAEWDLPDFIQMIGDIAAKVPKDANAVVSLNGGYDETTSLTVSYTMLESEEAHRKRVDEMKAWARERVRVDEANERSAYERLKAKYG